MQAGLAERSTAGEREGDGLERAGLATAASAAAREIAANWFAAYTHSHHEKRVASYFTEREIESFLPLYPALRRWRNGCEMKLELPLFPNYVFVRMDPRERVRVLEVPGVLSLVGSGRRLALLPDLEIEALRSSVGQRNVEPHPYLVVGERVRIKAGAMMGLEGVLVRKKNNFRVVLGLEAILQSVAVEVDADDLEVVTKHGARGVSVPGFAGAPQRRTQLLGLR
jgi:transcription antitermination factor NusG